MKFYLLGNNPMSYQYTKTIIGFVATPDDVSQEQVFAAWSYAVDHTLTDVVMPFPTSEYHAAREILEKRHPSWQCVIVDPEPKVITFRPKMAEKDQPE